MLVLKHLCFVCLLSQLLVGVDDTLSCDIYIYIYSRAKGRSISLYISLGRGGGGGGVILSARRGG